MKKIICQLYESSIVRYLFFGGCTTMVNIISFYIFRKLQMGLNTANVFSIILAILFAYVVNAKFVFQQKYRKLNELAESFMKFIGARATTMVIEVLGVWLLVEVLHLQEMFGKFIIQFIIIILNYIFSKLFVFSK